MIFNAMEVAALWSGDCPAVRIPPHQQTGLTLGFLSGLVLRYDARHITKGGKNHKLYQCAGCTSWRTDSRNTKIHWRRSDLYSPSSRTGTVGQADRSTRRTRPTEQEYLQWLRKRYYDRRTEPEILSLLWQHSENTQKGVNICLAWQSVYSRKILKKAWPNSLRKLWPCGNPCGLLFCLINCKQMFLFRVRLFTNALRRDIIRLTNY